MRRKKKTESGLSVKDHKTIVFTELWKCHSGYNS